MAYYIQEDKVAKELGQDLYEFWGTAASAGMDVGIGARIYKDEYRNAILQGYTPELARQKALVVAAADTMGGYAANAVGSPLEGGAAAVTAPVGGIGAFPVGIALNTAGGMLGGNTAGDAFDRVHKKGKYDPSGKGKAVFPQHQLDSVPYKDGEGGNVDAFDIDDAYEAFEQQTGMQVPGWAGGKDRSVSAAERATEQRKDMGVYQQKNGDFYVDKEKYDDESDEAFKNRMKAAEDYADKLNKDFGTGKYRKEQPPAQQPESEVQQTEPTNNNTPPVPSPQQPASEGPGPRVGPPPQNPGVTPPAETPGTPGTPTPAEPTQQPQAQNNGAEQKPDPGESEAQQQKNLTPMQQWAQKYPHLAQRLKPGQAGYDEVKGMAGVQNAKQPTAGGVERRTAGQLIKPDKTAQQNAAKVKQELQQARQNVDRAQQTQQTVATQNAQRAQDERAPADPIMRAASKVRDAGQKYGDKAFSTSLRPQKGFEPLTKKKIGDPLGESLDGLMDYLLD